MLFLATPYVFSQDKQGEKPSFDIKKCQVEDYDCIIARETKELAAFKKLDLVKFAWIIESLHRSRGIAYYKKGKYELALNDLEKATNKLMLSAYLGHIYLTKGEFKEAYKIYYKILERTPNDAEAHLGRGIVLTHSKNYELALEDYDYAIFLNPRFSRAYLNRGINYIKIGDQLYEYEQEESKVKVAYTNAIKDFDTVEEIDLANIDTEIYIKRASAYEKLGEHEKAKAERRRFEELNQKP
jgi:tetratricopeptide (TPR) repeat protein